MASRAKRPSVVLGFSMKYILCNLFELTDSLVDIEYMPRIRRLAKSSLNLILFNFRYRMPFFGISVGFEMRPPTASFGESIFRLKGAL